MACEGERNKCLLEKTEQKNSFIFQDFRWIFKDFFPYVEGNFKVTISSVLGQYSHRISVQELVTKGRSWDEKYCEWVFIQPSFWVFVKYFCIYFGVSATIGLKEGPGEYRTSDVVLYSTGWTAAVWCEDPMLPILWY